MAVLYVETFQVKRCVDCKELVHISAPICLNQIETKRMHAWNRSKDCGSRSFVTLNRIRTIVCCEVRTDLR